MTDPVASGAPRPVTDHTTWSAQGVGHSWQFRFFHTLLRLCGKRPAYHIMYIVTFWYTLFNAGIRGRTRPYLRRRFPSHTNPIRRWWDSYQLIRHFGMTLVDLAAIRILGERAVRATTPDGAAFAELAQSTGGFLLLNAHVGCWQAGLTVLPQVQKHVGIVLIPDPKVMAAIDPERCEVIDPRLGLAAVMQMTQALLKGHVVSMMADRVYGDPANVVRAELLGDPLVLPVTPYRLASSIGCPIVLIAATKSSFRDYSVRILDQFTVPPKLGTAPDSYTPYAQRVASAIEAFCREYPWQFYNFYDLWGEAAAGGSALDTAAPRA